MELHNVMKLYVFFSKRTSYIGLQTHNSTTAIAAVHSNDSRFALDDLYGHGPAKRQRYV